MLIVRCTYDGEQLIDYPLEYKYIGDGYGLNYEAITNRLKRSTQPFEVQGYRFEVLDVLESKDCG